MARISLIIPTRNRPHLLQYALRSALNQTTSDCEVVVSDNASDNGTRAVVDQFDDPRLRYVRTDQPLMMHESWSFALEQGWGKGREQYEYVGFLCDDDALHPRALTLASDVIERTGADCVMWRSVSYCSEDWFEPAMRGCVRFGPPFTDQLFEIDGPHLIDAAFDLRSAYSEMVPKMLNCVVSRDVIERISRAHTPLFLPSCPDYSAMIMIAHFARRIVMIDAPLLVVGATPVSTGGAALNQAEAARQYERELRDRVPNLIVPPAAGPPITWFAQTLMQIILDCPAFAQCAINQVKLYGRAGLEIAHYRAQGRDVRAWENAFTTALDGELRTMRDDIAQFVEHKRTVETESHLQPIAGERDILGIGPCMKESLHARSHGADDIASVATSLDQWFAHHRINLSSLWQMLEARTGGRLLVIFGMGLNGRAILRLMPRAKPDVRARIRWCDEHVAALDLDEVQRVSPSTLSSQHHFVLVTPDDHHPIIARLEQAGLIAERDFILLPDCGNLSPAPPPPVVGALQAR